VRWQREKKKEGGKKGPRRPPYLPREGEHFTEHVIDLVPFVGASREELDLASQRTEIMFEFRFLGFDFVEVLPEITCLVHSELGA
jgi:hypothetical protein